MAFRVQFSVTSLEEAFLKSQATEAGYPNIPAYCKSLSLAGFSSQRDYPTLYRKMVEDINKLPAETEFFLRDIIDTPPALLGKWLSEGVYSGAIPDVIPLGKDGADAEKYKKIGNQETVVDEDTKQT